MAMGVSGEGGTCSGVELGGGMVNQLSLDG